MKENFYKFILQFTFVENKMTKTKIPFFGQQLNAFQCSLKQGLFDGQVTGGRYQAGIQNKKNGTWISCLVKCMSKHLSTSESAI